MTLWKHYHLPHTVEEAVELLEGYAGRARVVGGGTRVQGDAFISLHILRGALRCNRAPS
jgi:hypothetical protein